MKENNIINNNNQSITNPLIISNDNNNTNIDNIEYYINTDSEDDYLPVYNTKNILAESSNSKRLAVLENIMKKESIKIPEKAVRPKSTKITYKDYKKEVDKYKSSADINFTIPVPFKFQSRERIKKEKEKTIKKIYSIISERNQKEMQNKKQFKATELQSEMFIGCTDNIIESEKKEREKRIQKRMEKIQNEMKPFSFVEKDEIKLKQKREKIKQNQKKIKYPKFKANPVKWTSKITMMDDKGKMLNEELRKQRNYERAVKTLKNSKLPPRLEKHEKEKMELSLLNILLSASDPAGM